MKPSEAPVAKPGYSSGLVYPVKKAAGRGFESRPGLISIHHFMSRVRDIFGIGVFPNYVLISLRGIETIT